jgi:tyrosine ammonia-lyase
MLEGLIDSSGDRFARSRKEPPPSVSLGPTSRLDCETVEGYALLERPCAHLTPEAEAVMAASAQRFARLRTAGVPIYGTTTGFGPFVRYASGDCGGEAHGSGLIAHLGAGWGPDAPAPVVRASQLLRAQSLAQGVSGVEPGLVRDYLAIPAAGMVPCVPEIGSVGASGDLIPLAHIARVLTGDGDVYFRGERMPAADALAAARLAPRALTGREVLALTNGTSFLTAYAALAVARGARLLSHAERLTGWLYRLLGARSAALDDRLHRARGHVGQRESARAIRGEAARFGDDWEDPSRPLQEVYSIRCAPQVLGACRENLAHARRLVETEANGVSDNPLFPGAAEDGEPVCLHGGNFQGQQVAFAADALNAALTQTAVLAERQIDALLTPGVTSGYAPLLLAWEPGPQSGLAGAQITATALVAEMRAHAQPHGTFSIPTNGGNQDVVSMGTLAARMAHGQTERLAAVLAILSLSLHQLDFLRREGRAAGPSSPPPDWPNRPTFMPLRADRPLRPDIAAWTAYLLAP